MTGTIYRASTKLFPNSRCHRNTDTNPDKGFINEMVDCEQSLFCPGIRGEERKIFERRVSPASPSTPPPPHPPRNLEKERHCLQSSEMATWINELQWKPAFRTPTYYGQFCLSRRRALHVYSETICMSVTFLLCDAQLEIIKTLNIAVML